MGCHEVFLDSLEKLTKSLNLNLDQSKFIGNLGCRYCGRWFKKKNDNEYSIWVGGYFDRQSNFELMVSFWVATRASKNVDNINYLEGLLDSHYHFDAEFFEIDDNGYYFSTKVSLFYCDCNSAKTFIETVIKEILEKSGIKID